MIFFANVLGRWLCKQFCNTNCGFRFSSDRDSVDEDDVIEESICILLTTINETTGETDK